MIQLKRRHPMALYTLWAPFLASSSTPEGYASPEGPTPYLLASNI